MQLQTIDHSACMDMDIGQAGSTSFMYTLCK